MSIDFDAIRAAHPLEGVVAAQVQLKRAGGNKAGCCPFHNDRTPSFVVYGDGHYHCFGCGAHGDVIDYVAAVEKVSVSEAIRSLTGGETPSFSDEDRQRREAERKASDEKQRRREREAMEAARSRWTRALAINGAGAQYLVRKNVAPYGCKREGENLLVPIYSADGQILSVQSIPPEPGGKKMFHAGVRVTGGRYIIGDNPADLDQPIVIVEGFATGATVQAATGFAVAIAFSKANLGPVASDVATRNPGRRIIIGADTNGVDEARAAAAKIGATVVVPELLGADGTDFNDQAGHYGADDVAALFAAPAAPVDDDSRLVRATPFVWRDAALIPKREWLYGKHLLRKFVSVDVAAGGVGKSSLKIGEALALATGRDLYAKGIPEGACTVWLWNLEDPHEEIERRIHATAARFKIKPEDIGERLYVDSGRDQPLVIATEGPDGAMIVRPVVDALIAEMQVRKVDVLMVDPFISSHAVSENDNNAIDLVAREWNVVAERTGAAINLVHHVRKQNGAEATADSARGASALIGKARSVLVYNRMTAEEAASLGADEAERRFFFRVDNDKANLAPPDATDWYRMNNVDLPNGDSVGVACAWTPPDAFDGITVHHLMRVQRGIAEGKWRENSQSKAWAGHVVASVLDLDLDDKKNKRRVSQLIRRWVFEGALEVVQDFDEKRMEKDFIVVGRWVEA